MGKQVTIGISRMRSEASTVHGFVEALSCRTVCYYVISEASLDKHDGM